MAILNGIPVLNCQNIETTLAFYQQLLQFVVVKKREVGDRLEWVHIMHGSTTLMLQANETGPTDKEHTVKSILPISLYFFVDNIEEMHHFLRAKNISVSDIKLTHYRMKEFSFTDPDNNRLVIGQNS